MRISDRTSSYFTIHKIGNDPRGDIHAKVATSGQGFSGSNKSVWFDSVETRQFIKKLRALDKSREGLVTLETMSPGECVLVFRNFDKLGNIHLEIDISRRVYYFGETDLLRCHMRFEVDPTGFTKSIDQLEEELLG